MRNLTLAIACLILVSGVFLTLWITDDSESSAATISPESETLAAPPIASPLTAVAAPTAPAQLQRGAVTPLPGAPVSADDPLGVTISGVARRPDGAPAAGAEVTFRRGVATFTGLASDSGAFAVTGPRPGDWQVSCRASGCAVHEATYTVELQTFQKLDIALRAAFVLRVKLIDADGQPIDPTTLQGWSGALPWAMATDAPLTGDLPCTPTANLPFDLGQWQPAWGRRRAQPAAEAGRAGELHLRRPPPLHVALLLRGALLQSLPVDANQEEVTFTLPPAEFAAVLGKIQVRLVNAATRAPLRGARVNLDVTQAGGGPMLSNDDGRITWSGVAPGWVHLEIPSAQGLERLSRRIRVAVRSKVDLGDLELTPSLLIEGVVLGIDGTPLPAGNVTWTDLDGWRPPCPLAGPDAAPIGSDGRFQFRGGRRRYVVTTRNALDHVGFATIDARNDPPTPTTIALAKATRVALRANFAPTRGFAVTVFGADHVPIDVAILGAGHQPDALWLPPGNYAVEIHDLTTEQLLRSTTLDVGATPLLLEVP